MSTLDPQTVFAQRQERILAEVQFEYDSTHKLSYGYWTHDCGANFYGGGHAMHKPGCKTADGYKGCTYHFGPEEVRKAKEWARFREGVENDPMPTGSLTLAILRLRFPQLVE